ncbi:hypothetical protein C0J52_11170 [Blattella germanica]|nr:hypothetical protein C0J52_11170 [Blattella germanica]
MEDILKCEETLLTLLDNDFTSGGNIDFTEDVKNGRFLKLLRSTKCQQIFLSYVEQYTTDSSVDEILEKSVITYMENDAIAPNQQLEVLSVGVASLYAFIQSNWTGPSVVTDAPNCVFPWLQSWIESGKSEKDVQTLVTECLILDGEACNTNMSSPELLLAARLIICACCSVPQPLTEARALGLRTKFQVRELPQLTVQISVPENRPLSFPAVQQEHLPKDLKLDDEVRLDKIKFTNASDGKFPDMHPIEQAVVLGTFYSSSNQHLISLLLKCVCILSQPLCWSLQMSALLERSNIEKDHSRSVERSMMQTEYAESIPHLRESLNINSLQVSLWFRLGFAALDQEDWNLCVTAYQRYCSLDPESFEAWNNLSKAYVKLNQKFRAWKTLQEALKWDFENWKLWDNYMVVSVDLSEFHEVMKAYNRILDLKPKHVDIEVLRILVEALTSKFEDPQLIQQAEKLFIRLTQEVRGNHLIWQQHAKLILLHNRNKESFDTMEKAISSLQRGFWCADEDFNRGTKESLFTMQLTSQLATSKFQNIILF